MKVDKSRFQSNAVSVWTAGVLCLLLALQPGCTYDSQGRIIIDLSTLSGSNQQQEEKPAIPVKDRTETVLKYLAGRDLDPIEGVWIWSNASYEVAIVRNTMDVSSGYDYVAIVTDTKNEDWRVGDLKFLLKETAFPSVFSSLYYLDDRSEYGTPLSLTGPNLIEMNVPSEAESEKQEKLMLIRTYPKSRPSQELVTSDRVNSGTGFFVAPNLLATNYHVVSGAWQISVLRGGASVKAELLMKDPQNDLALLKMVENVGPGAPPPSKVSAKCLALGDPDAVQSGDPVYTLGFPLSGILASSVSVSQGLVNNTVGMDNDPRLFQVSVPIQPGNSGSPLLDSRGRVIGIVTSTLDNKYLFKSLGVTPQNVNFAVKSSYLRTMLSLVPGGGCPTKKPKRSSRQIDARDLQKQFADGVVHIKVSR